MRITGTLFLGIILILQGCGAGSGGATTATAVKSTLAKPVVDFSPDLLAFGVGTYAGKCTKRTETIPIDGSVTLTSDFFAKSSTGINGVVVGLDVFVQISRELSSAGTTNFVAGSNKGSIALEANSSGGTAQVGTANAPGDFVCEPATGTTALRTKSIYDGIAKYLDTPKRKITCSTGDQSYELLSGVAKLGSETYSLYSNLKTEAVETPPINNNIGLLHYSSEALDGSKLFITLDHFGDLRLVVFTSKSGVVTNCTAPAS